MSEVKRSSSVLKKMPWRQISSAPGMLRRLPNAPSVAHSLSKAEISAAISASCEYSLQQTAAFAKNVGA